jgi:hypothetical protein
MKLRRLPLWGRRPPLWGRRLLATALVAASAIAACATQRVRNAPFRERPDSVEPGSLLGPFEGRVVDGSSGDPVAGALVYATWSFQAGYGLTTPAGYREAITSTDANGRYKIDRLDDLPEGGATRVTEFVLVVYKRGYVAYRSDRRFRDLGPRRDFSQQQNVVTLERWRAEYSHVRHLRYLGGGAAIASLTSWEAEEASAELDGRRGLAGPRLATDILPGERRVLAAQLLSEREIQKLTSSETKFETGPLGDQPDSDQYSSQHFRAVGQPETNDVAVRMYTLDPGAAQKQYAELLDSLPNVDQRDELADRSMRVTEDNIVGVAFLDGRRGVVVLITCGVAQCDSPETVVQLARAAHTTLEELAPLENP